MGGDQTLNPFLSFNAPSTHPANNSISLMTGVDNYELTRTMGLWMDEPTIKVPGKVYETLTSVVDLNYNPWPIDIEIYGTDGIQFSPDTTVFDTIAAFVSDLSRTCYFTYL
jgi:hypothetical protein